MNQKIAELEQRIQSLETMVAELEKGAAAGATAEKAEILKQAIESGKMTSNQARVLVGLQSIPDQTADEYLIKLKDGKSY